MKCLTEEKDNKYKIALYRASRMLEKAVRNCQKKKTKKELSPALILRNDILKLIVEKSIPEFNYTLARKHAKKVFEQNDNLVHLKRELENLKSRDLPGLEEKEQHKLVRSYNKKTPSARQKERNKKILKKINEQKKPMYLDRLIEERVKTKMKLMKHTKHVQKSDNNFEKYLNTSIGVCDNESIYKDYFQKYTRDYVTDIFIYKKDKIVIMGHYISNDTFYIDIFCKNLQKKSSLKVKDFYYHVEKELKVKTIALRASNKQLLKYYNGLGYQRLKNACTDKNKNEFINQKEFNEDFHGYYMSKCL
jgi:hypothetical protein